MGVELPNLERCYRPEPTIVKTALAAKIFLTKQKKLMITTTKIAYKIGFSSSLNPNTFSGYEELSKWIFQGTRYDKIRLQKFFLRGYLEGIVLKNEVRKENFLAAGKGNSGEA